MEANTQPLDRRDVLLFLAHTDLPIPRAVNFFDETGSLGFRFDDDDTKAVIAWVNNPVINPDGVKIRQTEPMGDEKRRFSDYGVEGYRLQLCGWRLQLWTAVRESAAVES